MLADILIVRGWGLGEFLIAIVVIAAAIAIMYVILGKIGVTVPPWIVQVFWIVVAAIIGIWAIRFVLTL